MCPASPRQSPSSLLEERMCSRQSQLQEGGGRLSAHNLEGTAHNLQGTDRQPPSSFHSGQGHPWGSHTRREGAIRPHVRPHTAAALRVVSFSETPAQELSTGSTGAGNILTPRKVLPLTNASRGHTHPARPVSAPAPSGANPIGLLLAAKRDAAVEANARAARVLAQKLEAERWETSGWRGPISREVARLEEDEALLQAAEQEEQD